MANWLKENWFKLSLIICLFVSASAVSYYFVKLLPIQKQLEFNKSQEEKIFAKNLDCKKYDSQIKPKEGEFLGMKVMSGTFYSSKTNSCLYVGLDWDDKIRVKDGLSGQVLFEETYFHNQDKNLAGTVGEEINRLVNEWKQN